MKRRRTTARQRAALAARFDALAEEQPLIVEVRDRLLRIGGEAFVAPPGGDPDLAGLLARGETFQGRQACLMPDGQPNGCHRNSAVLWSVNQRMMQIATGYGLTEDDGLWRQHTWIVVGQAPKLVVLETTVLRDTYFGFRLTREEALDFAAAEGIEAAKREGRWL